MGSAPQAEPLPVGGSPSVCGSTPVGGSPAACVRALARAMGAAPPARTDAELVDLIRALEELKSVAAAAQARAAAELDASVRAARAAAGVPASERSRGVAAQVALARRESPHAGGRHLGLARALVDEMPHTLAALASGLISEWRATLLVQETACLSREDRAAVDLAVAADAAGIEHLGDRALAGRARAEAYRLDPHAAVARARRAAADRTVTLRPAPDTMTYLTALLPVAQGVACYAALTAAADAAPGVGETRGRGQVMADTLVERLTGLTPRAVPPVRLGLVMTDRALLAGDGDAAYVEGYGPIPAPLARDLLTPGSPAAGRAGSVRPGGSAEAGGAAAPDVWLRRLFTHPRTGELVATDSRSRHFPPGLRRLLVWRDQTCRTPWCDAPIRHADHVRGAAVGGATSAANGQGLCEACNYAKQARGWSAEPVIGDESTVSVRTTTPTGHRYDSRPPPLPGSPSERAARRIQRTEPALLRLDIRHRQVGARVVELAGCSPHAPPRPAA
jgi:Domain of unknown function (DUF222)